MPKEKTIEAFEDVFSIWQVAFDEIEPQGRAIEFRSTSSFDEAHIKIYFVKPGRNLQVIECSDGRSRAVKIPSQFDGPGGVLAYVPYGTHEVFFDEGEKWSEMTRMKHGEIRLIDVALHEVGHTLDLGHSEVKNALMGAYYDGTEKLITDDDLAGISVVWGKLKSELMSKGVAAMALAPDERPDPSTVIVMGILEYYGMKEVPGRESNQKLLAIMRKYINWVEDDSELAWCSIMLDYIAKNNGIERPNSPAAVDWRKVGTTVDLDDVKIGDVMIFYRTKESDWRGHVGVFISHSEHKGYVWLLGGNQSNQVNIQHQSLAKLRKNGIRRLSYEK